MQFQAFAIDTQVAGLAMPGTQYDPQCRAQRRVQRVQGRPMRMSMDQDPRAAVLQAVSQGLGIGVHQVTGGSAGVLAAAFPGMFGELAACIQRLRQEGLAPRRTADLRPELLVVMIGQAFTVAVQQQQGMLAAAHRRRLGKQAGANTTQPFRAQQEIAIAWQKGDLAALLDYPSQQVGDFATKRCIVVISDPGLEEIAEDVQRTRLIGVRVQPAVQDCDALAVLQMQVGDEQQGAIAGPAAGAVAQGSTSTFWISTGLLGRFWNSGERAVVGMALILSTTSMPSTTLPKTA